MIVDYKLSRMIVNPRFVLVLVQKQNLLMVHLAHHLRFKSPSRAVSVLIKSMFCHFLPSLISYSNLIFDSGLTTASAAHLPVKCVAIDSPLKTKSRDTKPLFCFGSGTPTKPIHGAPGTPAKTQESFQSSKCTN